MTWGISHSHASVAMGAMVDRPYRAHDLDLVQTSLVVSLYLQQKREETQRNYEVRVRF